MPQTKADDEAVLTMPEVSDTEPEPEATPPVALEEPVEPVEPEEPYPMGPPVELVIAAEP